MIAPKVPVDILAGLSTKELMDLEALLTPKVSKYVPHAPTPKQAAFLLLTCREAFYGGAAGGGKALSIETPILTLMGWKRFGELTTKDRVLAVDGTWTEIEYVTEQQLDRECFAIEFNTGESIVADAEHLWSVTTYKHRSYWQDSIVNTKALAPKTKIVTRHAMIGRTANLVVPPYVLGLWLGDGNAHNGSVTVGDQDVEEIVERIHECGYEVTKVRSMRYQYDINGLYCGLNVLKVLRSKEDNRENAPETKHIPEQYLLSDRAQRLALLRGIMDSDGHRQARGRCEIGIKEKRLADDVCTLLAGLGIVFSRSVAPTRYNNKECPSYRITFSTDLQPFTLTRKLGDSRVSLSNKVQVKTIKKVSSVPVCCIRVKHPSHTFLVGKTLVPTHNSDALLMAALQYVDIPHYAAIIFRRTYADLSLPGALMDRAKSWLQPWVDAGELRWVERDKTYIFPSGATITFGYLEAENDKYRYASAEFQYIGFDELTQFTETQYRFLFSRLRRLAGSEVPLRMRSASNPGGVGHDWVKQRFITDKREPGERVFIPAKLIDNPHLDQQAYAESLSELDPITRAQLQKGDWDVRPDMGIFNRTWFFGHLKDPDEVPKMLRRVRYWDFASTDEKKIKKGEDPDYTVGLLLGEYKGLYYVLDIIRGRWTPHEVERICRETAIRDGFTTWQIMEEEPGSSGKIAVDQFTRKVWKGYASKGNKETGNKTLRATPVSAACERGHVYLVRAPWLGAFLDELDGFPAGPHDDQVDAFSGAYKMIHTAVIPRIAPVEIGEREASPWVAGLHAVR